MSEIARGLAGVVVTETRLSRVDGEAGELIIAGFPLEELAPKATFEEVLYLLWNDRLPNSKELEGLQLEMASFRSIPPATVAILQAAAQRKLSPMDAFRIGVDTLSLSDPNPSENSREANERRAVVILAAAPTIVATYWRLLNGQDPVDPDPNLSHTANYLYMLNAEKPHPDAVRAVETYLNTVVDHGMNASTFSSRVIVSTQSDMFSGIVGAIGALKGPLHGGAPGPALDMVYDIRERANGSGRSIPEEADAYVRDVVSSGGRIMGFGHRVYKVRDPRADVLGAAAEKLFREAGDAQLCEDARAVEEVVVRVLEELKPGRRLQTNVEFYTALVLHGVGMPTDLFTPTFGISRAGGWSAHILEQYDEAVLIRPQSGYNGELGRKWVPLSERK
ncbi:MAG: citrate synthase/methylcitrate synthase [Chloroflexi bacterium RBG_16_48_8]|nr:MAG: citrate synthase/methylcitrate synthase [Chloroflexi bacterium RBG_16_48_8]